MFLEGCSREQIRAANRELHDFVQATLSNLIKLEEQQLGSPSSLRIFARVDLSIMCNTSTGTYNYFVTGVQRGGPRVKLYAEVDHNLITVVANTFAEEFTRYLLGCADQESAQTLLAEKTS